MGIVIDITPIQAFFQLPPDVIAKKLIFSFGWIPFALLFLYAAKVVWQDYIQDKWKAQQKFILLAIDIPRGNKQTPKAVENIFTYLAGAHSTNNLIEDWWVGRVQLSFSCEIVSIDGYTQFLIHTPESFRNLVESAIYSQYPDAEITEVDDYTDGIPTSYPNDEYDVWGTEFIYVNSEAYPIKLYDEFVYQLGAPDEHFKDPMAALMDLCSSLKKGEQLWFQIIIKPTDFKWPDRMEKEVKKILGEKAPVKRNIVDDMTDGLIGLMGYLSEMVFSIWGDIPDSKKEEAKDEPLKMMNLKPREKKQIEAIQKKQSMVGFEAKLRFVYAAKKDVINKAKVVNGFVGYIKQFTAIDLNNFKPDLSVTGTSASYFFAKSIVEARKGKIVRAYKSRSTWLGRLTKIMTVDELATLWHFPVESVVKAPLIQKAAGKKSVPPMSLPMYEEPEDNTVADGDFSSIFTHDDTVSSIPSNGTNPEKNIDNNDDIDEIFKEDLLVNNGSDQNLVDTEANTNNDQGSPPTNLPFA